MESNTPDRIQHKQLYLTYNDSQEKLLGPAMLLDKLQEQLKRYNPYYGIACHENAPTTGTSHYHLLMLFKDKVCTRNLTILEVDGIMPHIEPVHNNLKRIIQYIKKNGEIAELNKDNCPVKMEMMNKVEKAKLMLTGDLQECFLNGTLSSVDIIRADKIKKIFAMNKKPDPFSRKLVLWFKGESGEGKTRTAVELADRYQFRYWMTSSDLKWFDGYDEQEVAIIDEFRKSMLKDWSFLLRLLDGYSLFVPVKGAFAKWCPKIVIITTPATPTEAFSWVDKDGQEQNWDRQEQLERRLTFDDELQVYEFPLWKDEEVRLHKTIRKFLGIEEEQEMIEEELSMSPILPEPTQIDEA